MPETETLTYQSPDMALEPDFESLRIVPWYKEPTAQVICDCFRQNGEPIAYAPRAVLKRVLSLYEEKGWRPIVAPELEFFLAAKNIDPDYPLQPPAGKNGRPQSGRQAYGIDAVNEFDPLFEDVYDFCEAQEIGIDSLIHEEGVAQVEMNFNHGDPMALADQTFLFKRTVASPRFVTTSTRPSWPSPTSRSRARRCTSTRAWSTPRARACSPASRARTRVSSSPTLRACRNTCRRRCR
jgi:glutamine synthetase